MAERPRFWRRDASGGVIVRAALWPLSVLYGTVMRVRNLAYAREVLTVVTPAVPTVSIGNLSVGGTGKTPLTAWLASVLAARGARAGIVLRGVGGDEPKVLAQLVPDAVIEVDPDRVAGAARAVARGASVLLLDDAFQHRRIGRVCDIVVWSADAAAEVDQVLPAGPLREPVDGLRRAGLIIVTRKAAPRAVADAVMQRLQATAPLVPRCVVALSADTLVEVPSGAVSPLAELAERPVVAVSGIGDPEAFERQLAACGARVTGVRYADHHAYSPTDVADLLGRIPAGGMVVCTLKDAVKLAPLWPDSGPSLWYLSQRITVEDGQQALDAALDALWPPQVVAPPAPPPPTRP